MDSTMAARARALGSGASSFARARGVDGGARNGATLFAMRHRAKKGHLSRPSDQRKALMRTLTTEVLRHGRIKTTQQKAKAIREHVDKVITWAKQASALEGANAEHKKNLAKSFIYDSELVDNVFEEAAERYGERPGGGLELRRNPGRETSSAVFLKIEVFS